MIEKNEIPIPAAPKARKAALPAVLGLVIVLGLGGFWLTKGDRPWQPDYSQIKLATVSKQAVTGDVTAAGMLDADNKSVVTSQLPGNVSQVMVKEGSQVKKGDLLLALDQKDLQVQINQAQLGIQRSQAAADMAKLAYDNAQTNYDRNQQLYNGGVLPKAQFEQVTLALNKAKADYAAAKLGLDAATQTLQTVQLNLAKTTVTSPIDGVVANCNVSAGDNVAPGVPLLTIVSFQTLAFTGTVNEAAVHYLKTGQEAKVEVDSVSGEKFSGTVSFVSPVSIQTGQFFPFKIILNNKDGRLKAGMTAQARIRISSPDALSVPNLAVFHRDGRNFVYLVKNGKAVQTAVDLGIKGDSDTEVVSGLKPGDQVVAQGTDLVMDGMQLPVKLTKY